MKVLVIACARFFQRSLGNGTSVREEQKSYLGLPFSWKAVAWSSSHEFGTLMLICLPIWNVEQRVEGVGLAAVLWVIVSPPNS